MGSEDESVDPWLIRTQEGVEWHLAMGRRRDLRVVCPEMPESTRHALCGCFRQVPIGGLRASCERSSHRPLARRYGAGFGFAGAIQSSRMHRVDGFDGLDSESDRGFWFFCHSLSIGMMTETMQSS